MKFKEWWEEQTKNSNQWTSLERMAAKDAWEFAEKQVTEKREQIGSVEDLLVFLPRGVCEEASMKIQKTNSDWALSYREYDRFDKTTYELTTFHEDLKTAIIIFLGKVKPNKGEE